MGILSAATDLKDDSNINKFFSLFSADNFTDGVGDKINGFGKASFGGWENIADEQEHATRGRKWCAVDANVKVRRR